jgi:hypothetical protein
MDVEGVFLTLYSALKLDGYEVEILRREKRRWR